MSSHLADTTIIKSNLTAIQMHNKLITSEFIQFLLFIQTIYSVKNQPSWLVILTQNPTLKTTHHYAQVKSSLKYTCSVVMKKSSASPRRKNFSDSSSTPFCDNVESMSSGTNSSFFSTWSHSERIIGQKKLVIKAMIMDVQSIYDSALMFIPSKRKRQ